MDENLILEFLLGSWCIWFCSHTAACVSHHPLTQLKLLNYFLQLTFLFANSTETVINQNGQCHLKKEKWVDWRNVVTKVRQKEWQKEGCGRSKPSQLPMRHHLKTCLLTFWEAKNQRERGQVVLPYPRIHSIGEGQLDENRLVFPWLVLCGHAFFGWPFCSETILQTITYNLPPLMWRVRKMPYRGHFFLSLERHTFASATWEWFFIAP